MLVDGAPRADGSTVAAGSSPNAEAIATRFVKVMPHDYKRALADLRDRARRPSRLDAAAAASSRAETEEAAR